MSIKGKLKNWIIRREAEKFLKKEGRMKKIGAAIEWLNAEPGRKRGVGAILLAASAVLRVYGQSDLAVGAEVLNSTVQTLVVPGMDILGVLFAGWGTFQAKRQGRL